MPDDRDPTPLGPLFDLLDLVSTGVPPEQIVFNSADGVYYIRTDDTEGYYIDTGQEAWEEPLNLPPEPEEGEESPKRNLWDHLEEILPDKDLWDHLNEDD